MDNAAGTVSASSVAGGGGFLVRFLDNTEHASLTEAFADGGGGNHPIMEASCLLTKVRITPPPVLPPKHPLLGILTSSQL